ncbi:MAG: PIG-L family deacetylase [Candidatus Omnitrophica bacterium]|nr:PIG-L family deacetylase [Candidatus Omnitrophota bacterium]MDD4014005.1 PIG-L family deacetylase [Candidatus Omnitrophota bacterium]
MKVLAIGSHPDDIEYGAGGLLLKMAKNKENSIFFFVATGGEMSGGSSVRKKEQEAAADFIGVKKIFWGGFKDTELKMGRELINTVESAIKESSPDMILVNFDKDFHQDHRYLAESTLVASRYSSKVLFYEDFTAKEYYPRVFADITDVLEDKVRLISFHKSQVERQYPTGLDIVESLKAVASYRGFQAKVKYAEGYAPVRYLLDV